jgi:predicted lipid-binding transport protein (Tim44 family)
MNRRTKLILLATLAVLALALIVAPAALAGAGGGSSGFGGGGGGGGGGGFGGDGGGGGRGIGIYILFQLLFRIAILGHGLGALFLIAAFVLFYMLRTGGPRASRFWKARESQGPAARKRSAQRERRVELAAAEASEDDPAFAPDYVRTHAAALFTSIQQAWDARDRTALARLVAPDLLHEWELRLDDFDRKGWHNRVEVIGEPKIEYLGLTNRQDAGDDRVTVRIEGKLRDYVEDRYGNHIKRSGRMSETVPVREFWTLGRRGDRWILLSIEEGAEGAHAFTDAIVATPWSDDQSMRDEAMVEQAAADALPDDVKPSEVADLQFDGDARGAALDLSLADGRFAPDVLEISARRAVAAWAEAVDGDDKALGSIAIWDAAEQMLHPGDPSHKTRVVVRGPTVKQIRIAALDAAATPPTMSLDVDIEGRRYIEDRDTAAVVSGSRSRATSFTEHWTMALTDDALQPWRIVRVGAPAPTR